MYPYRSHNGIIIRPTMYKSLRKCGLLDSFDARPFDSRVGHSVYCQIVATALVVVLLASSRPSPILRPSIHYALFAMTAPITAIVIRSVYRIIKRWSCARIGEKVPKVGSPSKAHPDSPAAISVIVWMLRIVTAGFHMRPTDLRWRIGKPMFEAWILARCECGIIVSGHDEDSFRFGLRVAGLTSQPLTV